MSLTLYHGSPVKDFTPTFGLGKDEHDYGRGFYTTDDIELGREWAAGQRAGANGWLHVYEADLDGLKVFDFESVGVLPWLAELMKHRKADDSPSYRRDAGKFIEKFGLDLSGYDVIRGWRANASFFFIASMFVRNQVDLSLLDRLLSLGGLGIQYFFKSADAFAALKERKDLLEPVEIASYRNRYDARDFEARRQMEALIYDETANPLVKTFRDLVHD